MSVERSRVLVEQLLDQVKEYLMKGDYWFASQQLRCAASLVDAIENHVKLTKGAR